MNQDPSFPTPQQNRLPERPGTARPRTVDGERRVITILFCDVVGSTNLAGQLDPEEWAEVMNEAFQYMIAPIEEYEGMVARLMGDAVLAFFGAPLAHEDDPLRAVLAGLNIVSGIQGFARRFRDEYGLEFNVRVGINTGPVVVGEIGSHLNQEYTAMGDAINLAARMEQTAIAGTVQISDDTFRLVAPYFDVWDIGPIEVKGKDEPVQAYRVLGLEPQPGRRRGLDGIATDVIGRDRELARLRDILQALEDGQSGIAFLIGEAGLGKSRLIAEARDMWRSDVHTQAREAAGRQAWTEYLAVSYGASRPYDVLKRQIRQFTGVRETDSPEIVEQRLGALASIYPEALQARMMPAYMNLLGEAGRGSMPGGEAFQRELHAIMREAAIHLSGSGPVVYVVDDLHWADLASIDAIRQLLPLVETERILFLFAMRPDWNVAAWQFYMEAQQAYNAFCSAIFLEPLAPSDSRELIATMLTDAGVPDGLFDLVQQKAEGNPYYVEEVVRTLIDSGALVREDGRLLWQPEASLDEVEALMSLPGNVQSLLTARFDRLDKDAQRTLQLASVIGRSFPVDVLETIADQTLDLPAQLKLLVQSDLIRQTATAPEAEYTFLHALTRDAAYETILHRQRRRIHRQVGEAFETLYPNRLADEAPRIAYQFAEGRDWGKAVAYYAMAGEEAARLYANSEAAEQFAHAIEVALTAPASPIDNQALTNLFLRRGRVLEIAGDYGAAQSTYEALQALGEERADERIIAAAMVAQATLRVTPTPLLDPVSGREMAVQALELSDSLGDDANAARAHWSLMLLHLNLDPDPPAALQHGERALAIARELELTETEAYVLNDLGRAYLAGGRLQEADTIYEAARNAWEQIGNRIMLADLLGMWAQGLHLMGQLAQAEARAREGLSISEEIGSLWGLAQNSRTLALLRLELGDTQEADALLAQSEQLARDTGHAMLQASLPLFFAWRDRRVGINRQPAPPATEAGSGAMTGNETLDRLWQVEQLLAAGQGGAALALMGDEFTLISPAQAGLVSVLAALLHVESALAAADYEVAARVAAKALDTFEALGIRAFRPDLLLMLGEAESAQDHQEAALHAWQEAATVAHQQNARHALWQALGKLAEAEPDAADAQACADEASRIVTEIFHSIEDDASRAAFMSRPDVATVLTQAASS